MDLSGQIWQVALALILIIGLVLVLGVIAKRMQHGRGLRQGNLTILESASLGPKEKLVLVQVEGRKVLLGMNAQCIAKLVEYEDQVSFDQVLQDCSAESSRSTSQSTSQSTSEGEAA